MGRPSKICGSDSASISSPHQRQPGVQGGHSSSPGLPAVYLGTPAALLHSALPPPWRGTSDDWPMDPNGPNLRRGSDTWSGEYSDSGTGGLLTDDGASLEPSPKRRHSDSLASSSSPYQFSPPPSRGGSSVDLAHGGQRSGSADSSQRSRQSSMSSQDTYHG